MNELNWTVYMHHVVDCVRKVTFVNIEVPNCFNKNVIKSEKEKKEFTIASWNKDV